MTQEQRGGLGSTNIQIGNLHSGLTYQDVKSISKDVYDANMPILAEQARHVANARAEELRHYIDERLRNDPAANLDGFSHPEKQQALFEAQKTFSNSGDEKLKESLTSMIMNMYQEKERSTKSLILSESIRAISRLSQQQLSILATTFVLRFMTLNEVSSLPDFSRRIYEMLSGRLPQSPTKSIDFRHLESSGCASISFGKKEIETVFMNDYLGLFQKGLTIDEMHQELGTSDFYPHIIMPCLNDKSKWQIAALNNTIFEKQFRNANLSSDIINKTNKIMSSNRLSWHEAKKIIDHARPETDTLHRVIHIFENSSMKNLTFTSIGLAISYSVLSLEFQKTVSIDTWLDM